MDGPRMMDVYEKKGQDACVKEVYAKCFRHASRTLRTPNYQR
jgi:hypothetical protein